MRSPTSPAITVMLRAAEKAARSLIRDFGEVEQLQVSQKGPADFVSAADHRAEDIIFSELSKARPDFGFLMEERGTVKGTDGEHRWIVDPLDGTTNFLHGIPHWSISIALEKQGEIVAGLVYDAVRDEVFHAEKGGGAFMRGNRRLRVSARRDLRACVVCSCSPALESGDHKLYHKELTRVLLNTAGYRRLGSAALELAYVAAGRLDAFWSHQLSPWDMAAGSLIIREAGGYATALDGRSNPVFASSILAANPQLHPKFLDLLVNAAKS